MEEDNKDFHTKTKVWSESLEKEIKNISSSCEQYKWMNIKIAKKITFKYNILMYTSIIIGPITGILSASSEDQNKGLNMCIVIFSFLTGVLSAIIKFSEFGEKAVSFKNIAVKYACLQGNINRQLALEPKDRVNAGAYLEWVSTSYDELFSATPLIPEQIHDDCKKYFETQNKVEKVNEVNISIDKVQFSDAKMKYELARLNRRE